MHYYWQILYVTDFYNKQRFISFCVENTYVYVDFWYIACCEAEFWKKLKKNSKNVISNFGANAIKIQDIFSVVNNILRFRKIFVVP